MIGYLLILLFTVLNLGESITVKTYAKRHGDGGMIMNAIISLCACAFFALTDTGGFYAPLEMLPLALINVVLYASGFYFAFLAFGVGPFGLTRLISSFSLLFSIFYGIFFLNEKTNAFTYIGLALIIAAMVLINFDSIKKSDGKENEGKISFKWIVYILITLISNGFITILTRMQQIKFEDACSNEFQMISTGGAFLLLGIIGLITDRNKLKTIGKNGILYGIGAGLLNGAKNYVSLLVYPLVPLAILAPTKTGLSMIASFIFSIFFYKEKYTLLQKIGVICGTAAIIILAIK